jgi:tetraacyldisaccharide-1-P 4'-kinase
VAFGDHHWFERRDIRRIEAALQQHGATTVVTTAKDGVRLQAAGALPFAWRVASMHLVVEPWDLFSALVAEALARRRAAA